MADPIRQNRPVQRIISADDNYNKNTDLCRVKDNNLLQNNIGIVPEAGLFNLRGDILKLKLHQQITLALQQPVNPPSAEEMMAQNLAKAAQFENEWNEVLRNLPANEKNFDFALGSGMSQSQNFYLKTYQEGLNLLGTGSRSKYDSILQRKSGELEIMGRVADFNQNVSGKPENWNLMKEDERLALQVKDLSRQYPAGTRFEIVNYTSSTSNYSPYYPTVIGDRPLSTSEQQEIAEFRNYIPSKHNFAIAVTTTDNQGNKNTEFVKPALNGIPPQPAYYKLEFSRPQEQIFATIDVSHLARTDKPKQTSATINIGAIESYTDKTLNSVFGNYDKFVSATFAKHLYLRGNEPRQLSGTDLTNEIGLALNIKPNNPPQTDADSQAFNAGNWSFFSGEQAQRVATIEQAVKQVGGDSPKITVLPLMLDAELPQGTSAKRAIIEISIFRVTGQDGKEYFVDDVGRTYSSFEDWKSNNQLPPGKISYPTNGQLRADGGSKPLFETVNTPNVKDTAWEYIKPWLDGAALVGGIVIGGIAIFSTGGLATPLVIAAGGIAGYGAATSANTLYDRYSHGQSLSLKDSQARSEWINLGASVIGMAALGQSVRAINLANKGVALSSSTLRTINALNVASQWGDTIAAGNSALILTENWDKLSPTDKMAAVGQMAFWSGMTAYSARQAGGLRNLYGAEPAVKFAESYRADRFQAERIAIAMGADKPHSRIQTIKNITTREGLININDQLNIHPSLLKDISDADLQDLVRITKQVSEAGGDEAAFNSLPKDDQTRLQTIRRDHNLRFEYQRQTAEAFIEDLGFADNLIFQNMDEAEKGRFHQGVVGESVPGIKPDRTDGKAGISDFKQQAANWAIKDAKTATEFIERYQFYIAQFKRLLDGKISVRKNLVEQSLQEWKMQNPSANRAQIDRQEEILTSQISQSFGSDRQLAGKLLSELGDSQNIRNPSDRTLKMFDSVLNTEREFWQNQTGETRLVLYPKDRVFKFREAQLESKVRQIADNLTFGTELSATYHTRKHFPEIANSNNVRLDGSGKVLEGLSYLESARETVRNGNLVSVSNFIHGKSRTLTFERVLSDGKTMKVLVAVTDNGDARILSYMQKKIK